VRVRSCADHGTSVHPWLRPPLAPHWITAVPSAVLPPDRSTIWPSYTLFRPITPGPSSTRVHRELLLPSSWNWISCLPPVVVGRGMLMSLRLLALTIV